jgi:polysaccharide deacetylase 2 family uncharacterized protein YibQ
VATDDLYSPLGLSKKPARFRLPPVVLAVAAGVLGIGFGILAIWVMARNDPFGGEPMAVAKADLGAVEAGVAAKLRPSQPDAAPDAAAPENTGTISPAEEIAQLKKREKAGEDIQDRATAGRGEQIVTIIDGRSGARQEVKIPAPIELGIAPAFDGGIVEMTRDGPIPRVGANGMRAATVYAQPSSAKPNAPQIAIVITGIGTSNATATEALNKLPAAVTLAFAPGGGDLERLAGKARSLGHELLLQVPMAPTESAEQNPAPQALLTSLPPDQNIERLHWLMGRFQGYVGIAGRTGGRSTTSEAAFAPILREITNRGLIYVDDGSSGVGKANLVLDAVPSPAEIDRALAKLEGLARQNGAAIGFATAWPVAIERIARWSKAVEGRGFSLVPITAAAARGKPS